jgi:hypothetical protein
MLAEFPFAVPSGSLQQMVDDGLLANHNKRLKIRNNP